MNRIYSIVWSTSTSAWVVASELATGGTRARPEARALLRRALLAATIGGILGVAPPLRAQSVLYWDGNDTGPNADGGTGTWSHVHPTWDIQPIGGGSFFWPANAPLPTAVFSGAGTVTINNANGNVTASGLTFTGGGYSFIGSSLTLSGTAPNIEVGGVTNVAFSVTIEGTGGLLKFGAGTLAIRGAQAYASTEMVEGTVVVDAGATLTSHATIIDDGASLDVAGRFFGTDGNDTFVSSGRVQGDLAFGAGDDAVHFDHLVTGGPMQRMRLDGGAGANDVLTFTGADVDGAALDGLQGWERVSLESSRLTLASALHGLALLTLDAGSALFAGAGASIGGGLHNAGALHVGTTRLGVGGDYVAQGNGSLHVTVSPGTGTAGGLSVAGDVVGTTPVVFSSDGSAPPKGDVSILVVESPNDTRGNGGFTVANIVRLEGSPLAWTFAQADDANWYLGTGSGEDTTVVPEVAGYATLSAISQSRAGEGSQALFSHMDALRGDGTCGGDDAQETSASLHRRDCSGTWMVATGTESRVGANPGYAYSGDSYGLYAGADHEFHDDRGRTVRVGAYGGFVRGNYWTSGASSGPVAAAESNLRINGPLVGVYGGVQWARGAYVDMALAHQADEATVRASDGFTQALGGGSLNFTAQGGWHLPLQAGWSLEPQLLVGVTQPKWDDKTDAGARPLVFDQDAVYHARAALRIERLVETGAGAWRPWLTLAMEDTIGEPVTSVAVGGQALPGERFGQQYDIDAGVEASLGHGWRLFGALNFGRELNGTSVETRQARVGARWSW